MTVEQQRMLLFFWTSVKYLPSDGFSGLGCRLFIYRASSSRDHLPTSQTCFYHLNLPAYTSLSMMQRRLHMIVQEHMSSGFGVS
jgi:E3 ubiquitin-protein ligase NEDD4